MPSNRVEPGYDLFSPSFNKKYMGCTGFMISEDAQIQIRWASGKTRIYPAGTFNTGQIYPLEPIKVMSDGTCVSKPKVFFVRTGVAK